MEHKDAHTGANVVKLILTVVVLGTIAVVTSKVVAALKESLASAKGSLKDRGVSVSSSGVSVKTDRRAMTAEETQDKLQSGLMKGWKSSSFEVPWILQKGTHLGGSKHDKSKAEWEAKHGHKAHKNHVD